LLLLLLEGSWINRAPKLLHRPCAVHELGGVESAWERPLLLLVRVLESIEQSGADTRTLLGKTVGIHGIGRRRRRAQR
jgi:hypothetical protein